MGRAVPQDRPRCFGCRETVDAADVVFGAPCGHQTCPSVVWHGLHFMEHLDRIEALGGEHVALWVVLPTRKP